MRGSGCGTVTSPGRPRLAGCAPSRGPNRQTACSSWWAPTSRRGGRGLSGTAAGENHACQGPGGRVNFLIPSHTAPRDPICFQTHALPLPTPQPRALSAQTPSSSLTSRLEGFEHPSHCPPSSPPPAKPRSPTVHPWRAPGSSPLPGGTACSCQTQPCGSASGPVNSLSACPHPRRRGPQALFFVSQAQSHIPSQQPALFSHPLIHGNWEGLLEQHSALGQWVWREDILVPSL